MTTRFAWPMRCGELFGTTKPLLDGKVSLKSYRVFLMEENQIGGIRIRRNADYSFFFFFAGCTGSSLPECKYVDNP